jgi:phage shock protein C
MSEEPRHSHVASEAPGPAPEADARVLRRSREDRVIFGVAGGLARYLGVDTVVVRIAFVLLAVFGGSGILLYLVGLLVMPEERPGEPVGSLEPGAGRGAVALIGAVLILVGTLSLASRILPAFSDLLGPALLISLGLLLILGLRR